MPNHNAQSSEWIWTEYWRSGRTGCLTDDAPAGAQERIGALWRSWFRALSRGARVADLATGCGEVARIAGSVSEEEKLLFEIEGVDLARLEGTGEQETWRSGTTMRLTGGIDIARLPFADESFDAAVSQFGIEYAELEPACLELARVLKRDARGLFLVHHTESAITAAAAARLQAFSAVFGDGLALDHARLVYEAIAQRAPPSSIAMRLSEFRHGVRKAMEIHAAQWTWEANLREVLGFLSDLARNPQIYDPFDALRRLDTAHNSILAWKIRQQSQMAAARDAAGMEAFADALRTAGLNPGGFGVVKDSPEDAILAWRLPFAGPLYCLG